MSILAQAPSSEQTQAITEFESWLDAVSREINPGDEDEMFDDGPVFEPTADDLVWLREQQEACERLGIDELRIEDDIEAVERHLAVNRAARYLCRNREDDHSEFERRGYWGGHSDGPEGGVW